ncbi:MAG: hypothetical protein PVG90_08465 [Bacillota bacterium]
MAKVKINIAVKEQFKKYKRPKRFREFDPPKRSGFTKMKVKRPKSTGFVLNLYQRTVDKEVNFPIAMKKADTWAPNRENELLKSNVW